MNRSPMEVEALARRIRRLEDRNEISELIAHYSAANDDRDMDRLAELFTSDATVAFGDAAGVSGREAVIRSFSRFLRQYGPSFHYPHAQTVEFLGEDEATGTVTGHAEMAIGGVTYITAVRYVDRYAREGGSWRFKSRRLWTLYFLPLAELPTALGDKYRKRSPGTEPAPAELPESLDSWKAFASSALSQKRGR